MNVKILFKTTLLLACLFLSHVSFTQTSTTPPTTTKPIRTLGVPTNIGGGTGPDPIVYCLNENMLFQLTFEIKLANLIYEIEGSDEYGTIPSEYPDMYFQIKVNGNLTEPILLDKFGYYENPDGLDYYRIFIDSPPLNFNDKCSEKINGEFEISMIGMLVTKGKEGLELYPACDYLDSMFPCSLYPGYWCGEKAITITDDNVCEDIDFRSVTRTKLICDCDEVIDPIDANEDTIDDYNNESSKTRNNQEIDFSVYPNPVSDILNVEHGSIKSLSIYNTMGILNYSTDINELATHTIIDFQSYSSGVYFMKIEIENEHRILKIIKK